MFRSVLRPSSGVSSRTLRNYYVSACLLRRIPVCGGMLSVIYKYLYYSLRNVVIWDVDYYTRGCVAYLYVYTCDVPDLVGRLLLLVWNLSLVNWLLPKKLKVSLYFTTRILTPYKNGIFGIRLPIVYNIRQIRRHTLVACHANDVKLKVHHQILLW